MDVIFQVRKYKVRSPDGRPPAPVDARSGLHSGYDVEGLKCGGRATLYNLAPAIYSG